MYCKTIRIFNQTIPGTAVGDVWSVHGVDLRRRWCLVCNTGSTCLKSRIYGNILDFEPAVDTPEILLLLLLLLLLYGRINSRMTSYLKVFVLIDFHFQDAIFPFNRAAPYGMTSAVPREQGRTSARSAERPLALDPRPHSSAAARASLRFLVRRASGYV